MLSTCYQHAMVSGLLLICHRYAMAMLLWMCYHCALNIKCLCCQRTNTDLLTIVLSTNIRYNKRKLSMKSYSLKILWMCCRRHHMISMCCNLAVEMLSMCANPLWPASFVMFCDYAIDIMATSYSRFIRALLPCYLCVINVLSIYCDLTCKILRICYRQN